MRRVLITALVLFGIWINGSVVPTLSGSDPARGDDHPLDTRPSLLLDREGARLDLFVEGRCVASWPILELDYSVRRDLLGRKPESSWIGGFWSRGRVIPDCSPPPLELDVTASDYEAQRKASLVPPSPEEQCPAPSRWWIAFADRRSLEIRNSEADRSSLRAYLARFRARGNDRIRIRIWMTQDDAGTLFRSVPDSVAFAVRS